MFHGLMTAKEDIKDMFYRLMPAEEYIKKKKSAFSRLSDEKNALDI